MKFIYIDKKIFHRFQQPAARVPQPRPNVKPVNNNNNNPRAKRVPDNKQKQPDNKVVKNAVRYLIRF